MQIFSCKHSTRIEAPHDVIWNLFADVTNWPRWNAGIERIAMTEPFRTGSTFEMTVPGQPPMTSKLVDVRERERFVDETIVGDLAVTVAHEISREDSGAIVTFELTARGPGSSEIGPAIASDFPEVLAALKALAETTTRARRSR
jgi:hypothetical protein